MSAPTTTRKTGVTKNLNPLVSIVIPAHNEEKNVPVIHEAIRSKLAETEVSIEIVFVDDGSTDDTAASVTAIQEKDADVRLIRLVRNFGHQAALMAGMTAAKGDAVIVMDCDMQHPPIICPP
jgi:dolichol-phosphate mannosyltransferase